MLGKLAHWLFYDPRGLAPWNDHVAANVPREIPNATVLAQGKWSVRGKTQHFRTYKDWHGKRLEEVSDDGRNWRAKS